MRLCRPARVAETILQEREGILQPQSHPTGGKKFTFSAHRVTDSTIPPPPWKKKQRFPLTNVSGLLAKRKDNIDKRKRPYVSCVHKGLSNDDVGVSRDTVFQEMRPGAGFETGGDFVDETSGGLP